MPTISNVVEIIVEGTVVDTGGQSKNIFNVFHYVQSPTVPNPSTAVSVANAFLVAVWNNVAALLSIGFVGGTTLARYLDDVTFPFLTANAPANGSIALPRLPSQQAGVFAFRSTVRGKNFRGSKHFSPLATASVVGDELAPGVLAAWNAVGANLIAQVTAAGQTFSPCIVSRSLSQLRQNPVNIQGAVLTQALLNKTIGTMRRRKERTVR